VRRQIGFDREIKPEWMDYMASLYLKGFTEKEAREAMKEYLTSFVQGKESRRKIVNSLIRIWYKSNNKEELTALKKDLLNMDTKSAYKAYLDLIRKSYQFFDDVYTIIRRLKRLNGDFKTKDVVNRIIEKWGDYPRVEITASRAVKTYRMFDSAIKGNKSE